MATQFNMAQNITNAQNMAQNTMQLKDMQQQSQKKQQLSNVRQEAVQGGYDVEEHKQLLMEKGFFEEAMTLEELKNNKTRGKQDATIKGMEIINRTAQITASSDGVGWPVLRKTLIDAQMADEESLPQEYDEQARKMTAGLVGNTGKMLKVWKFRSGDNTRDIMTRGGNIVREGDPYSKGSEKDSRSAFEKQVDSYSTILMNKFPNVKDADARLLAADVFIHSKEKTDLEAAQKAYEVGLRSSFGDIEEANNIKNEVLKIRGELKSKRQPEGMSSSSSASASSAGGPSEQLPAAARQHLKEGKETTFKNGQVWSLQNGQPVRVK